MRPLGPGSPRSSSILLDEAVAEQALPPWPDCDRKGHGRGGDFSEVELELELEEDLEQELEQEQEQEQEQGHDGGESNGGGGENETAEENWYWSRSRSWLRLASKVRGGGGCLPIRRSRRSCARLAHRRACSRVPMTSSGGLACSRWETARLLRSVAALWPWPPPMRGSASLGRLLLAVPVFLPIHLA